MKQKEIFLLSEGDAWFIRNQQVVAGRKFPDDDALLKEILDFLPVNTGDDLKVLEVGCGDGTRLAWLKDNLNPDCYGVRGGSGWLDSLGPFLSGVWRMAGYATLCRIVRWS